MEITNVKIRKINSDGKMKAVASVTFDDAFVVHDIKVIENEDKVFVAGTIGTVSEKTAYGFAKKYFNDHNILVSEDEITKLAAKCVGTKRITGQHPGGIMIIPQGFDVHDFTPLQHPADDPTSKVISTHLETH